ncbi:MAG: HAMP domain-containing protein [Magnetovibrio sp.]|nr:HAMP domain-containing protein [Magnetovibrio sp.]
MAFTAAVVTGVLAFVRSESALEQAAFDKLEAVQKSRISQLSEYLKSIEEDLKAIASNHMSIDALEAIATGWDDLGSGQMTKLQKIYISDNPNKAGEKHKMNAAPDGSNYSAAHAKYHPWFREFLESRGYYDIFLIDNDGNVSYSVFKEADFATNLNDGQWAGTDIAKVYKQVKANYRKGYIAFSDFSPYAPSADTPASFIATPIFDHDGSPHGTLIFQMPVERLNNVMQNAAGMGETGESYIVGTDLLMRSDSRFLKPGDASSILNQKVDTAAMQEGLSGKDGVMMGKDYRGIEVLTAFGPLDFNGTTWVIMAEIDMAEVDIPVIQMRNQMIIGVLIILTLMGALGFLFARSITKPISAMTDSMAVLANGNLNAEIPSQDRSDEIGEMAEAVQVFKDNAIEVKRLEEEQKANEERATQEKRDMLLKMASEFENSVGGVVNAVSSASTEMQSSASSLSATAEETSKQSTTVAAASEEASTNVQTVASAAEELSSSISEIARQVSQSTQISATAVTEVEGANDKVQGLAQAAQKIGEVVALITDIADQTNLLALNATIEAARAGEAGKGFAVVASEVKNLANQTAKATEEISSQIGGIQSATEDAVQAIGSIGGIITQMNEIASTIAAAVEEQGAATSEIARNVEQAAQGTGEVSSNISGVTQAAAETGASADQMLGAAKELSQQSELLRSEVDKFLSNIRSG